MDLFQCISKPFNEFSFHVCVHARWSHREACPVFYSLSSWRCGVPRKLFVLFLSQAKNGKKLNEDKSFCEESKLVFKKLVPD